MPGGNESEYPLVTTESPLATAALFGMLIMVTYQRRCAIPLYFTVSPVFLILALTLLCRLSMRHHDGKIFAGIHYHAYHALRTDHTHIFSHSLVFATVDGDIIILKATELFTTLALAIDTF